MGYAFRLESVLSICWDKLRAKNIPHPQQFLCTAVPPSKHVRVAEGSQGSKNGTGLFYHRRKARR